jgi:hypothetical protein
MSGSFFARDRAIAVLVEGTASARRALSLVGRSQGNGARGGQYSSDKYPSFHEQLL